MIAYKFLCEGAVGRFSEARWPAPGAWLEAEGTLEPCANGVHACPLEALAYWFDDELWAVELDGEILDEETVLVARRGRLVERIDRWPAVSRAFADDCAARARELAAGHEDERVMELVGDAQYHADRADTPRHAVVAAYCAAVAADTMRPGSFDDERAWQSRRLAERLGLGAPSS
jgi:hypothetical protein